MAEQIKDNAENLIVDNAQNPVVVDETLPLPKIGFKVSYNKE